MSITVPILKEVGTERTSVERPSEHQSGSTVVHVRLDISHRYIVHEFGWLIYETEGHSPFIEIVRQ